MYRDDNVGDQMACRRDDCNTALPELEMDAVVEQCRSSVANQGRQKDQRYYYERKVVVLLQLQNRKP